MVPRAYVPAPLTSENAGNPVKIVAVPLPAIATNPNEGITYGALNAFLIHDRNDHVTAVVAPQGYYNRYFGTSGTIYGAFYPQDDRQWEVNLSKSARVNEDYELRFFDRTMLGKRLQFDAFASVFTDGSARFFGFESKSRASNETNYADSETSVNLLASFEIRRGLRVAFGERFRRVAIKRGAIESLPFIRDRFTPSHVPGIEGFTTNGQRLGLIFDSLDSRTLPTSGFYGRFMAEINARLLGSEKDYRHYELELKGYFSKGGAKQITVVRLMYNQALGSDIPFLERSILGGENTLRGYGRNRFIDSSFLLVNVEERFRIARWRIFNVNTDFELAPFVDVGAVSEDLRKIRRRNIELNPGLGIRGVVRPNIVGRIDIGVGREGAAVFVGLGYPF
jgi:outer membrane protein assembly factor BamA